MSFLISHLLFLLLLRPRHAGSKKAELKPYEFESPTNRTFHVGEMELSVADGTLVWPGIDRVANFSVLTSLLTTTEVDSVIDLLPRDFDRDKDSVDDESTFEFYLEKNGTFDFIANIPGKPDIDPAVMAARLPARAALAEILRPIMESRIAPYVNEYVPRCRPPNKCRPCFSLVRRYLDGERRAHDAHFDIQALATVVVGLNSAGRDFEGGLFISAGSVSTDKRFIQMQKGDAVVHTSDLLHGVQVPSGARWSWILWFSDAENCR
jgi:hypothetical protein